MSGFEYLIIIVSLVVGVAIADVMAGVRRLATARDPVRWHWLPLGWALFFVLAVLQDWYYYHSALQLAAYQQFLGFLLITSPIVCYALAASSTLPEPERGEALDLRDRYFERSRWVFGLAALTQLLWILNAAVRRLLLDGAPMIDGRRCVELLLLLLFAALWTSRSERVHGAGLAIASVLLLGSAPQFSRMLGGGT